MKLDKYDKILLTYCTIFFLSLLFLIFKTSTFADEGTHALLALFYRDLFKSILLARDLSFSNMYAFGISYLTHYPKLQVFYPPLYHFLVSFLAFSFNTSIYSARILSLTMGTFSLPLLFSFTKRLFNKRVALITAILFSLFPGYLTVAKWAMMETTTIFFIFLSLHFYLKTWEKPKLRYYIAAAIFVSLATLSKQPGFLFVLIYASHILLKRKYKECLIFLTLSALFLSPYLLLLRKIGGAKILPTIYERYAFEAPHTWFYFITFPFLSLFCGFFFFHLLKERDKVDKFLLLWFIIGFVGINLISFKLRYFIYFLPPLLIISSAYLSRLKFPFIIIFLSFYLLFSLLIVKPTIFYFPIENLSRRAYETLPPGGNIAMVNEKGEIFSSAFMLEFARHDKNKIIFFFRPCVFLNQTGKEMLKFLKENNVYYLICVKGERNCEKLKEIKKDVELFLEEGEIQIYRLRDFEWREQTSYKNLICLTGEWVETTYFSPFFVYSSHKDSSQKN